MRKVPKSSKYLLPSAEDQTRPVTIAVINGLIANTSNPQFREWAEAFRATYQDGDTLVEFCSSRTSWDDLMGSAGFMIVRDGEIIDTLLCKMN